MRWIWILGLLIIFSIEGYCCTCFGESDTKSSFKEADFVAVVEVLSVDVEIYIDSAQAKKIMGEDVDFNEPQTRRMFGRQFRKFTVKSIATYKGLSNSDTLTIYTGIGSGDCGYDFELNEKFNIYGRDWKEFDNLISVEKGNLIWTDICNRTMSYRSGEEKRLQKM